MEVSTIAWLCVLVLGMGVAFFAGKKHGVNLERAAKKAKEAIGEFHNKKEG